MSAARAIVSRDALQSGGWKLEDVTVRSPGEGELLVEMVGSGICHTDVLVGSIPAGMTPMAMYPRVLGHEGGGYVKEVGPGVTVAKPGDAVLLSYASCRDCAICLAGAHAHCTRFTELNFADPADVFQSPSDGQDVKGCFFGQSSFANLSVVKQTSVVNVQALVHSKHELQLFSPLGCGIQTGSGTVLNAAKAGPSDIVAVFGLGGVGLSAVMAARIADARMIIGVDRVASRLSLARDLGCTHTVDTSALAAEDKSLVDAIRELAEGSGPTVTVDTTGVPALIQAAYDCTRNKGRFAQVGTPPFDFKLEIPWFDFMMSGKELIGVVEGQAFPPDYVPKMIQWYREGKFPIDKFFKLIPAEDFQKGLQEMHDGTTIKPVILWS